MAKQVTWKLKAWRRGRDLTQAEAARMCGVSKRTWLQWEMGRNVPNPDLMVRLWKLTGGELQPNDFYALPSLAVLKAAA